MGVVVGSYTLDPGLNPNEGSNEESEVETYTPKLPEQVK